MPLNRTQKANLFIRVNAQIKKSLFMPTNYFDKKLKKNFTF